MRIRRDTDPQLVQNMQKIMHLLEHRTVCAVLRIRIRNFFGRIQIWSKFVKSLLKVLSSEIDPAEIRLIR